MARADWEAGRDALRVKPFPELRAPGSASERASRRRCGVGRGGKTQSDRAGVRYSVGCAARAHSVTDLTSGRAEMPTASIQARDLVRVRDQDWNRSHQPRESMTADEQRARRCSPRSSTRREGCALRPSKTFASLLRRSAKRGSGVSSRSRAAPSRRWSAHARTLLAEPRAAA